jgi:transcriptional regulator with XRE-family HTH domain
LNSLQPTLAFSARDILSRELEQYLSSTPLSMRQISKKLGITCSYLSQIKGKKKSASIEVGLKILELCQSPTNTKRKWLNKELQESGDAYHEYINELKLEESSDEKRKNATKFLCAKLEHLNIYIDIINEKAAGLSQAAILRKYGQHGLNTALQLREHHLVDYIDMRFHRSDLQIDFQRDDAFSIVNSVFEDVKVTNKDQEDKFKMKFFFKDLSPENAAKVERLYQQFEDEVMEIYKNDSCHDNPDRERVFFQLSHSKL